MSAVARAAITAKKSRPARFSARLPAAAIKPPPFRPAHPGDTIYTFCDHSRNACARDAGLPIDHLLLSPALADRLTNAQVDMHVHGWQRTSDHAPVWIGLADKPKRRRRSFAEEPADA